MLTPLRVSARDPLADGLQYDDSSAPCGRAVGRQNPPLGRHPTSTRISRLLPPPARPDRRSRYPVWRSRHPIRRPRQPVRRARCPIWRPRRLARAARPPPVRAVDLAIATAAQRNPVCRQGLLKRDRRRRTHDARSRSRVTRGHQQDEQQQYRPKRQQPGKRCSSPCRSFRVHGYPFPQGSSAATGPISPPPSLKTNGLNLRTVAGPVY